MKDGIYNGRYRVYSKSVTKFSIIDTQEEEETTSVPCIVRLKSDCFTVLANETLVDVEDLVIMLTMLLNAGITSTEQLHELLVNAREAKNRSGDCPF